MNQTVSVFHHHYFILLDHRHQNVLQFALPKLTLIELRFHRLTRSQVRKAAHEEEGVGIFDRKKWTQDLHPYFRVRRNRLRAEYLKEPRAAAGLDFVGPHFYDHVLRLPSVDWRDW